jgi:hypothetical protein
MVLVQNQTARDDTVVESIRNFGYYWKTQIVMPAGGVLRAIHVGGGLSVPTLISGSNLVNPTVLGYNTTAFDLEYNTGKAAQKPQAVKGREYRSTRRHLLQS